MPRLAIFLCLALLLPTAATADKRVALLIGNQNYGASVGALSNPHSDIALMGAALEKLGFKVTLVRDADYRSTDAAIKRHIAAVRREGPGAIGFFYYSGHGAANPDTKSNFLIPVDVANADDEELWTNSLNLTTLVENLRGQAQDATHYVVFDACRNELNLTRKGQKALTDKGFVPMAYTPGVLVAFATAPGNTASDTGDGGGTYARALSEEMVKPGIESVLVFTRAARRVQQAIGQEPFLSASTMPEIYFAGEGTALPPPPQPRQHGGEAEQAWAAIKDSRDPGDFALFRRRFGKASAFYDGLAARRIEELEKQSQLTEGRRKAALFSEAEHAWAAVKDTSDQPVLEAYIARFAETAYGAMAQARLQELRRQRSGAVQPAAVPRQPAPVTPAAIPPRAAERYGAIAYSPTTGVQGWVYDYASKEAAEAAALGNCALQAGDCTTPVSFRDACGALAVGTTSFGAGSGADRRAANGLALKACGQRSRNCTVLRQVCTSR
jgi:uncharacterized caspase-like protein